VDLGEELGVGEAGFGDLVAVWADPEIPDSAVGVLITLTTHSLFDRLGPSKGVLVGLDRQRADVAGQAIAPVPGLCSTTAAGLARKLPGPQWTDVEIGMARVADRMLDHLPVARRARLSATATIDLDTTDVEVYGRHKRGVVYNHPCNRCGRPVPCQNSDSGCQLGVLVTVQAIRRYSLITPPRTEWRRIAAPSGMRTAGSWLGGRCSRPWCGR
jgi:hypothetical protein